MKSFKKNLNYKKFKRSKRYRHSKKSYPSKHLNRSKYSKRNRKLIGGSSSINQFVEFHNLKSKLKKFNLLVKFYKHNDACKNLENFKDDNKLELLNSNGGEIDRCDIVLGIFNKSVTRYYFTIDKSSIASLNDFEKFNVITETNLYKKLKFDGRDVHMATLSLSNAEDYNHIIQELNDYNYNILIDNHKDEDIPILITFSFNTYSGTNLESHKLLLDNIANSGDVRNELSIHKINKDMYFSEKGIIYPHPYIDEFTYSTDKYWNKEMGNKFGNNIDITINIKKINKSLFLYPQIYKAEENDIIWKQRTDNCLNSINDFFYNINKIDLFPLESESMSYNKWKEDTFPTSIQKTEMVDNSGNVIKTLEEKIISIENGTISWEPNNSVQVYDVHRVVMKYLIEDFFKYIFKISLDNYWHRKKNKDLETHSKKSFYNKICEPEGRIQEIEINIEIDESTSCKRESEDDCINNRCNSKCNPILCDEAEMIMDGGVKKNVSLTFKYIKGTDGKKAKSGLNLEELIKKIEFCNSTDGKSKNRYLIVDFGIISKSGGHSNKLLFDLKNNRIIRIEPHGFMKSTFYPQKNLDCIIRKTIINDLNHRINTEFDYINDELDLGSFSSIGNNVTVQSWEGICEMVSSYLIILSILFPKYTLTTLTRTFNSTYPQERFMKYAYYMHKFLEDTNFDASVIADIDSLPKTSTKQLEDRKTSLKAAAQSTGKINNFIYEFTKSWNLVYDQEKEIFKNLKKNIDMKY